MASLSVLLLLDACHHAFLPRWKLIYVILNQNKLSSLGCLWPRYFITAMESVWCRNLTVAPSLLKLSLTPNRRKGPVLWRKTQIYPSISHVNNTHGCVHSDVSHLKPWCLWDGKNTNKIFFCPKRVSHGNTHEVMVSWGEEISGRILSNWTFLKNPKCWRRESVSPETNSPRERMKTSLSLGLMCVQW